MSDNRRPKLEIPVSKDPLNPLKVTAEVLYDDPKKVPSTRENWGDSYMYTLRVDGVEHVLFASEAFHRTIQEAARPVSGTVINLARIGEGTDTKWAAQYVSGPQGNGQAQPEPQQAQTQSAPPTRSPAPNRPAPAPQQNSGYVYEPLSNYAVIQAMAQDNAAVYALCYEAMRSAVPTDGNGQPAWDEERIGAAASTVFIALQHTTRSLVGRTVFSALNNLEVAEEPAPDPEELFREWVRNLDDAERMAYEATTEDKYLAALMVEIPRYAGNTFAAKAAAEKFCGDELPLNPTRSDALARVLVMRRAAAYAKARNGGLDSPAATMRAIEQVGSLDVPR